MSSDDTTQDLGSRELLIQLLELVRGLDSRQKEFEARLQNFDARLQGFDSRLEALERKVDERLYDTRPMWEAVQTQMAEFRGSTELEFRKLNSKFDKLALTVYDIYADQKEQDRRVSLLESRAS